MTVPQPMFALDAIEPLAESDVPAHFVDEVLLRMQRWFDEDVPGDDDEHIPVTRAAVETIAAWLGGGDRPPDQVVWPINPARPSEIAGLSLLHRLRLIAVLQDQRNSNWRYSLDRDLPADYRHLHEALVRAGISDRSRRELELTSLLVHGRATRWRPQFRSPMAAWQHHVEHPALLRSVLGVGMPADKGEQEMVTAAIGTLIAIQEHGPVPPADSARVAEYAVGALKSARAIAQKFLAQHLDGVALMAPHLEAKKADAREETATWIGRHGTAADAALLRGRLDSEPDPAVRGALLGAVIRLGVPAEELLTPAALTQEAIDHDDADTSALAWLRFDDVPAVAWTDGTETAASVVRWWLVYADNIGDPTGKGLIPRYLDALDLARADELGRFVLEAWIAHDTQHPSEDDVRADLDGVFVAVANKAHPNGIPAGVLTDKLDYTLRHRHLVYVTSAIANRGLLALTTRTDGAWFADTVSRFLRDHRVRRAQAEALLRAASVHPAPEALQLLLDVARRYRQKSVQALVVDLVAHVSERRGWTPLQLADRTVPSAGLDDDGRLMLDFGPRRFVACLTDSLTLALYDADPTAPHGLGASLKALPDPTSGDDARLAAEAKKDLTGARSELKKVVAAQRARLADAMVAQVSWPGADWNQLVGHPIMRRLVAEYVWAARGGDGTVRLARPDGSGTPRDASGAALAVGDGDEVTIAHTAVLDAALLEPWRDPKGRLPANLAVPAVDVAHPLRDGADALDDFAGWIIDARVLRGAASKRGYERGQAEDDGVVFSYTRHFEQAAVRAEVDFSGTAVGQRDGMVSLGGVRFYRASARDGIAGTALALAEVPPVLLAEVYADYAAIGAKAVVADPEI